MELKTGQTVVMKKAHPCGCSRFTLTRVGMDIKIRCQQCGREVMLPRKKVEKNIRQVITEDADV